LLKGPNPGSGAQIASLIQDIKRILISKRYYSRKSSAVWAPEAGFTFNYCHKKLIGLRTYQGKGKGALKRIQR